MPTGDSPLQGDALKQAIRQMATEMHAKMAGAQQGIGTFSDHALAGFITQLEQLEPGVSWEESISRLNSSIEGLRIALQRLQLLASRRSQGRYVEHRDRVQSPNGIYGACDMGYFDMVMSQGVFDCLQWKGLPLFKTVYDFAIYPMLLSALRPRTIFEVGSGNGASAIWLADIAATAGVDCDVHSVDLKRPAAVRDRVRFIEGDAAAIADTLSERFLRDAPHPWLVLEDAHVNVHGVLAHFHPHVSAGDYVVVEDSATKQDEIGRFVAERPGCYKVDTYFTDFFGRNVTCAQDSILVRA
jgi:cephalosporin hydroxylase